MNPTDKPETRNPKPETTSQAAALRTLTPLTPMISTLRLDLAMKFKPGQSIATTFPGDPKKRYYSISSSPTEGAFVEITVKCNPESLLAQALANLKRGDVLDVEGPFHGGLSLPQPLVTTLCFIAAGTGVTPFRSMVKSFVDEGSPVDIWLLHSVKRQEELLFRQDFTQWAGGNSWFHYVPTITQDFDDNWINETGRINETLVRKHVPDKPVMYLLSGPMEFVKDIEAMLRRQLNVPAESIRREKW